MILFYVSKTLPASVSFRERGNGNSLLYYDRNLKKLNSLCNLHYGGLN